jgi:hypothetical protein
MKRSLLILLLLLSSLASFAFPIKDACLEVTPVNSTTSSVIVKIVVDPTYTNLGVDLYWHDGSVFVAAVSQIAGPITLPNGDEQYIFDLGTISNTYLLTSLCLYTTWDYPGYHPPVSPVAVHFCAYPCRAQWMYECLYKKEVNGVMHNFVRVTYDQYLAGQDVTIYYQIGGAGPYFGGVDPSDKNFYPNFNQWVYDYDLGPVPTGDPNCYDIVVSALGSRLLPNNPRPYTACRCTDGCNPKFNFCINTATPNTYTLNFENQDPTAIMQIAIDGSVVYNGPAKKTYQVTGSDQKVCIKLTINGVECDEYCKNICFP